MRKRQTFSAHAKLTDKEKLFLSAQRQQFRTAPKLTCSNPFRISLATVSLQYNNPFSKNLSLASALQLSFRTDSKPLRRRFAGKTGFDTCRENFCKITSGRALNRPRSPEVRKPLVYFWYFSYTRKVPKTFLSQEVSRFRKPRISTPQPQLRTATIKTFLRKLRGFANLESAHKNNNCALTNLNPSAALRQCPCRDGTLRVLFAAFGGTIFVADATKTRR